MLKKILGIGIPNGLENSMFQLGKIMVLSMITQFGTASIAANAVSNTIAVFQTLPGMAIGNAVLTVSAQCAGAGDYEQVKYYAKKLHIIIYGLMIVCCLGVIAVLPAVLHVYSLSAEATAMTEDIIVYHGICCMIIWPIAFNLPNVLRASNDVAFCMIPLDSFHVDLQNRHELCARCAYGIRRLRCLGRHDDGLGCSCHFLCPSLSKREVAASDVMKNT